MLYSRDVIDVVDVVVAADTLSMVRTLDIALSVNCWILPPLQPRLLFSVSYEVKCAYSSRCS